MHPDFSFETKLWSKKYHVIGVDEVGRGCLAGPVFAAAFYIPPVQNLPFLEKLSSLGINDSKKLSPNKRQKVYEALQKLPVLFDVTASSVEDIHCKGIVAASQLAMRKAVENISKKLNQKNIFVLSDGFKIDSLAPSIPQQAIIKGDSLSMLIAAASIMAKVERDAYMAQLSSEFPDYLWHENKGYGTKLHREAIKKFGTTPHHRTLFLRNILSAKNI